jgi:hypothetical protein
VLVACWGIQLLRVSFTRLATAMISCLLTSGSTGTRASPSQQRSAGWGQHCWTWASSWCVDDELQNIQAILPSSSSSSEILSER